MEGTGKFIWPCGKIYEGQYKNNMRHGQGKQIWPDGKIYEGFWLNDKRIDNVSIKKTKFQQ